jgi:hypothetical protein
MIREEWDKTQQELSDVNTQMLNEAQDTSYLDNLPGNIRQQSQSIADASARNRGRYGISLNSAQTQAMNNQRGLNTATTITGMTNQARDERQQRLMDMARTRAGFGLGLNKMGADAKTSGLGIQKGIKSANYAAQQQEKNAWLGLGSQVLGALGGELIRSWGGQDNGV